MNRADLDGHHLRQDIVRGDSRMDYGIAVYPGRWNRPNY